MEGNIKVYVGWIVSGGFKYSLTASNGVDKTIGFALADSILINYESVMYSNERQTGVKKKLFFFFTNL